MQHRSLLSLALGVALTTSHAVGLAQYSDPGTYYSMYSSKGESIPRAVGLVRYLFGGGASPQPVAFAGNVNCERGVDMVDVVYLVNWALRGGPIPCGWVAWHHDPSDTRDAETIAMWESNEMTAPAELLERVQADLWRLRTLPGADQTALSSLHFSPRWFPSYIGIMVDSVTHAAIEQGLYHAWDSLNAAYDAHWGDFWCLYASGPCFGNAWFSGIYNSPLLADLYDDLPGILSAHEEEGVGGRSQVYPMVDVDTNTYLFTMSWNFAGTFGRTRYWYCMALPDSAWIIGDWDPKLQPEPWWWDQALVNMEHFWPD